jgi:hypothetical protein
MQDTLFCRKCLQTEFKAGIMRASLDGDGAVEKASTEHACEARRVPTGLEQRICCQRMCMAT